jgi:hypothetical protein
MITGPLPPGIPTGGELVPLPPSESALEQMAKAKKIAERINQGAALRMRDIDLLTVRYR